MEPLYRLIRLVEERSTNLRSHDHGPNHWRHVARTGLHLAELTPGADARVVFLFGLFHDAMRENDLDDPEHGVRGARLARELHARGEVPLKDLDLLLLCEACEDHNHARSSDHPTIGVCYDADRLHLWRVGIEPCPTYFSTLAGPGLIQTMRGAWREPIRWCQVVEAGEACWQPG